MVSFNPYVRPTIEECLSHPYFASIRKIMFESTAPAVIDIHEIDGHSLAEPPSMHTLKKIIL